MYNVNFFVVFFKEVYYYIIYQGVEHDKMDVFCHGV